MKKLASLLVFAATTFCTSMMLLQPAPQVKSQAVKPVPAAKKVYPKGRVEPKNLQAIFARQHAIHVNHLKALPKITAASWDCRTLGLVPPIVDQGQCGSCWDFSGTSICTSAFMKQLGTKAPGPLSEQFTLDCGQNGGCNGDDNTTVTAWCKATGLPTTADYGPYQASSGSCKKGATLYKIADWGFCTTADTTGVASTQDIKNAMVQYGPIGSAIAADDAFMNINPGTVFAGSGSTSIDHDIVLCGWDDSKGKAGAWLLRNSWGTSWVDAGYCWIEYGANLVGTEAIWVYAGPQPSPPSPGPVPPGPTPPGPVPPTPPPTPGSVTIALTADQVNSVFNQTPGGVILTPTTTLADLAKLVSGNTVTIDRSMTIGQMIDAIEKSKAKLPTTKEPPLAGPK